MLKDMITTNENSDIVIIVRNKYKENNDRKYPLSTNTKRSKIMSK